MMNTEILINPEGYYESPSGLLLPKSVRKPRAFDFFAGVGGFSLGFIKAGFEVVGMNEIDFDAIMSYCVNLAKQPMKMHFDTPEREAKIEALLQKRMFPPTKKNNKYFKHCLSNYSHESEVLEFPTLPGTGWILSEEISGKIWPAVRHVFIADIKNLKGEKVLEKIGVEKGELDVVMGGPPCQGYSKSGKQDINDPRNELIFEYARMIVEMNPRTFVMEEVPDVVNFRTPRGTYVLEEFGMILDEGGYMEFSQFCEAQKFVPKSKRFRKIKPNRNMGNIEKMPYQKDSVTPNKTDRNK